MGVIRCKWAGKYEGMDRYECRKALVKDLEDAGYLIKTVPHKHNVGSCYRCGTTVEPITSNQWFVKMKPLAEPALEVVNNGTVKFEPERFTKTYTNWMENVHDWCISRQLWWGHRIPAYYCADCGEMVVAKTDVTVCPKCGGKMTQESDVLDTWFSSALWPFSTLGWPDKTPELEKYYPTSVLVTGYDIIFFWVARMIFSGLEHMGKEPFSTVFIHGLVRDAKGRKMSKSLGNGIDPLEIIDQFGADALRFALATGNAPGNDMRFSDEKIESARNFANKLWNAARFVMMNLDIDEIKLPDASELATEDKWILSKLNTLAKTVQQNLDCYEVGVALANTYDFVWDIFCDWYIELLKPRLSAGDKVAENVIAYVLTETLKMLHPFMPFITEEIYTTMPHDCESIMISSFPKFKEELCFEKEEAEMEKIISLIKAIRARRTEMGVAPSRKAKLCLVTKYEDTFKGATEFFKKLASASEVEFADTYEDTTAVQVITDSATAYIPLADMIDFEAERKRLEGELKKNDGEIKRLEGKLSNEGFIAKAPAAVVEGERAKLAKYHEIRKGLEEALAKLG